MHQVAHPLPRGPGGARPRLDDAHQTPEGVARGDPGDLVAPQGGVAGDAEERAGAGLLLQVGQEPGVRYRRRAYRVGLRGPLRQGRMR